MLGLTIQMDLHELGLTGKAIVLDIEACPPVRSCEGRVVTATFHHTSGDVIDLVVANEIDQGEHETIGTTSNHPFWSVDRQEYVQAGSLRKGEHLRTIHGDTKRVISKLARPGPESVYNLEVFGEHTYFVGKDGVLVHNNYHLSRKTFAKLAKDPDKFKGGSITLNTIEEIRVALAGHRSKLYGKVVDRGTDGVDFVTKGRTQIDVKRLTVDDINDSTKMKRFIGVMKSNPEVKYVLDPRNLSESQVAGFRKWVETNNVDSRRILMPKKSDIDGIEVDGVTY